MAPFKPVRFRCHYKNGRGITLFKDSPVQCIACFFCLPIVHAFEI